MATNVIPSVTRTLATDQFVSGNLKSEFVRYIEKTDDKGRLIGIDVVKATKNPNVMKQIVEQIEANKPIIKEEKETQEKLDSYLSEFTLKKLITCFNFCLPLGKLGSYSKYVIEKIDQIQKEKEALKRADLINELINVDDEQSEQLDYFKSLFNNMED